MVIKLLPLGSKLTLLYFALWGWDSADYISPWPAFSLLGFIDENARDWKKRGETLDFFGLIPIPVCATPNTTFHSGYSYWIQ